MANEYTPAGGTGASAAVWIQDRWRPGLAMAAYEKMKVAPHFDKLGSVGGKIHVMKFANLARNTLLGTTEGSNLSKSGQVEVEVTATPQTSYVFSEVNLNTIARMMFDPSDKFRSNIEMSIAEGVDVACAKLATDMVSVVVGSNAVGVTEATFRNLNSRLAESAKGYFEQGVTEPSFICHSRQIDDVMGDPAFTQYQYRGDGTPLVKGWVLRAHGASFYNSGNIQNTAGTMRNMLLIDGLTMGIGYNQTPDVKYEEFLLSKRIIGWTDFAVLTIWQEYGGRYDTTPAQ
jgi:hypothetical protein